MLENTKDIIFTIFFRLFLWEIYEIVVRSGWFRFIHYLQKKEDFWESFSPIALELTDRRSSDADQEYIYFIGSETSPSLRYKLLTNITIPSARI